MSARIERLLSELEEPLLVTNRTNVFYLTGFRSSNAALLVERQRVRLFTDFRYVEAARDVREVELVQTPRALVPHLAELLQGRIGFEADSITYAEHAALARGGLDLVARTGVVERLRAVKGEEELEAIRRAAAITDRAYGRLAKEPFLGRTERELAWQMEQIFREEGSDEIAFPIIVATGANGAKPHADPGDRRIEPGQTVVVDAGCTIAGYNSDCTRTFATNGLPDRLREAYAVCLDAQQAGVEAVRAGAEGRAVDAVARDRIDATGFKGMFGHGLGHGVGLEVHERPALRPESADVLAAGNVVTVEPGIYIAGEGGIRIEDLVVVTDDGCQVLSEFTKELVTVD